jgi:hypothetical protein
VSLTRTFAVLQREMQARLSQLNTDNQRKASALAAEREEAERARSAATAAQREADSLQAQLAAMQAQLAAQAASNGPRAITRTVGPDSGQRRALYSDHSSGSASSTTVGLGLNPGGSSNGRRNTPRTSSTAAGGSRIGGSSRTPDSGPRPAGSKSMTPEEKHIRRMRQVMIKREEASGLSSRCALCTLSNCLGVAP